MENRNNAVEIGTALPEKMVLIVDDKYSFLKVTGSLLSLEPRIRTLTAQSSVEAFDAGANGYIVKCSSSEGSLKDKVTGLLFLEDNSAEGQMTLHSSIRPTSTQRM